MCLQVFQLGVILQPSSSEALCHLGNGQLMQYDATSETTWLAEAELSFRSSIAMEGKTVSLTLVPDKLKEQAWWKKKNASSAPSAPISSSTSSAKKSGPGPVQTGTKSGPVQGHCAKMGPVSRPAAGAANRKPPPTSTSTKSTGGTAGAARKPGAAVGGAGSRAAAVKGGPSASRTGTGGRGTSGAPAKPAATDPKKQQQTAQKTGTPASKTTSPVKQANTATAGATKAPTQSDNSSTVQERKDENAPKIVNPRTHHARLGLARALTKNEDKKNLEEAEILYEEVVKMAPELHDAYIELGEMLAKTAPAKAVSIYSKFPFSDPPTFDDAFLHGEIVRLVMKNEDYDNPQLTRSLIAMGKALGINVIDKQVAILEGKFKSAVLKTVYAGIHGKPIDDSELQAFFKFKCWL